MPPLPDIDNDCKTANTASLSLESSLTDGMEGGEGSTGLESTAG